MGMGKYKFAAMLQIHYHTYDSFIKSDRKTRSEIVLIIINFLKSRGKSVEYSQID